MLDRRTFIAATGLMTVAPAFDLASPQCPTSPAGSANHPAFLIDGWSIADEADGASQMWLRLNAAWRAAWQ
jgi:hypothetical protein